MVIFACLIFPEFLILVGLLFTKFRTREFSFFFTNNAIIIIIFAIFLNLWISSPREIREKLKPREYYQIHSIIYGVIRLRARWRFWFIFST